jgi:glycosyltransferase involved in cell wall biosynthesis
MPHVTLLNPKMPLISVVSPVFNEGGCIQAFYAQVSAALSTVTEAWQIVLVDDGSRDDSWKQIRMLAERDARVTGVRFSRNFGHHIAITAGLDHCDGDWVVTMDSDLQDPPEAIPLLLSKAREGFDVVVALREARKHHWVKRMLSRAFYAAYRHLTGTLIDSRVGVFRIMSRRVVESLKQMREFGRFFVGMVEWVGFPQGSLSVEQRVRYAGRTKYPLGKQILLAIDAILSFSESPLKFVAYTGLAMSVLSVGYGLYIVGRSLAGRIVVLGYASLAAAIFFTGGLTVFTVGIVGLYVGRIFRQVQGRPLYIVAERTALTSNQQSL